VNNPLPVKVLVTDYKWPSLDPEREILASVGAGLVVAETAEEDELIALAGDCEAILTCWKPVTAAVLDAAPRCVVVSTYGVGVDNIAVEHATALGMVVANVPDFCVDEVSEHAFALILALVRKVVPFAAQTRAGGWDNAALGPMHRLRGQTLGLIGAGRIGQATATKAHAFGMNVIALTRSGRPLPEPLQGVSGLDELLERADVLCLHAPHTPETDRMIGEAELRKMKPSAFLINTARGPLIDQDALVRALREGWIAGAGLDVLTPEPPDPADPLRGLENAIVTPHASFYSEESISDLQRRGAGNVRDVLGGQVPDTVVNREVLDRPGLRMARG
jgi:D-3-phosphoglycerate dehydrogenase / 2-oxoglutarate reductase